MVVPGEEILLKRRVLYIGSSVPLETSQGLEAVQQPLRDRYSAEDSDIQGIDAFVSVTSTGIQIQYVDDPSTIILFPISALNLCAAVRRIKTVNGATGENNLRFVSLTSPQAKGVNTPAIFTAITRRTKGRKVLECHGFICPSEKVALELVKATSSVDKSQKQPLSARSSQGFDQQSLRLNGGQSLRQANGINGYDANGHGIHLLPGDIAPAVKEASSEFYDEPPAQGYFYTSSKTEVKSFNVEKENVQPPPQPVIAREPTINSTNGPHVAPQPAPPQPAPSQPAPPQPGPSRPAPPQQVKVQQVPPQGPRIIGPPPSRPVFVKPVPPPVIVSQRPPPVVVVQQPPPPKRIPPPPQMMPPPPPMMRVPMYSRRIPARHFSPPPRLGPYPYMMMPPPPPPIIVRRPRRRSLSSGSNSKSSRESSPTNDETHPKHLPNGDFDSESEFSRNTGGRRPRTPPRDYDYPPERLSRRDQYEKKRNRSKHRMDKHFPHPMMARPPFFYGPPPPGYPMPPPPPGYPMRSRSVPPPMRYPSKPGKKSKKNKKGKKKYRYAPSDMSTDHESYGYASEIPMPRPPYPFGPMPGYGNYHSMPRKPRDFRESQFINERNFSKTIAAEHRNSEARENFRTAYELNDPGTSGDANIRLEDGDFTMY